MGRYVRNKKKLGEQLIVETLNEAEHDHYLDCPNAEYRPRMAAFVLDVIFITLIISGISRLCLPAYAYLRNPDYTLSHWGIFVQATQWAVQAASLYFYLIGCQIKYGATAGKLLFELRVVNQATGQKLSTFGALRREILGKLVCILTLGVGFFTILMREDGRGFHDLIAGSVVKKNETKR